MATLANPVVSPVLASATLASSRAYKDNGVGFDYAIGGLPFLSYTTPEFPARRKSADVRKQQFDNAVDVGEQSTAQWWIKAMSSFHCGAGQRYLDSASTGDAGVRSTRFAMSCGVDVWTAGQVSLLPSTVKAVTAATAASVVLCQAFGSAGEDLVVVAGHGKVEALRVANGTYTPWALHSSAGTYGGVLALCGNGQQFWTVTASEIRAWSTTAGTVSTVLYTLPAGVSNARLGFVKQRLVLALNTATAASVFELDQNASSASLPSAKFSNPNRLFTWTGVAESPQGILVSGYAGTSTIYKFVLDSNGAVPTLTTGITVADLPPGEKLLGIHTYLGTHIGMVTSAGFRMGVLQDGGDIRYGGLTVEMPGNTSGAVTARDRFFYCAYTDGDGVAGVARVDLSQTLSDSGNSSLFAWAPDVRCANSGAGQAGSVSAVTVAGGQVVMGLPLNGVYGTTSTPVPSGWLRTSRIRYASLDPKLVRFVRVRAEGAGTVGVAVAPNSDAAAVTVGTFNVAEQNDSGDLAVSVPPCQYASVILTLTAANGVSPVLSGFQLKALPAQKKQRIIQVCLSCFDSELTDSGQRIGGDGTAFRRLLALEKLDEAGDVVLFQKLSGFPEQAYSALVVIDDLQFVQVQDPTPQQGWGGVIVATLRTVT